MITNLTYQCSPTVTVAITVLNEAEYVESVIRGFSLSNYPNLIEIFVTDSGSTDETPDIIDRLSQLDPRVHYFQNPVGTRASGLNAILQKATGEIFLRADAHALYAPDYIEQCVNTLLRMPVVNVGGAQRFVAKTPFQAGVALASRSFLGNGGATHRNPEYTGYGESVYLGCLWRRDLLALSGYSLDLPSEDADLNLRLASEDDRAPKHPNASLRSTPIYISADIKVWYYPRETWIALWQQYFNYGRGRYLLTVKYPQFCQMRGKLPFFALLMGTLSEVSVLLFQNSWSRWILLCLVGSILVTEVPRLYCRFGRSLSSEIWRGDPTQLPSVGQLIYFCTLALLTLPIAHACGYGYQLIRTRLFRQAW